MRQAPISARGATGLASYAFVRLIFLRQFGEMVDYVIETYACTFEEQVNAFPEAQKQLLIAIAKEGKAEQVTSVAFCKKHALKSPSTVQSALRVLHDKGIVARTENTYFLTNRFLGIWLAEAF